MRRTLVALVLALAVLGAGCSSQPSAVAAAQKAESRKQKAESRKQKAETGSGLASGLSG
jgi:starvation-inducible outer membrane lipoprotein